MKMISLLLLAALTAFDLGCGYGSKATTPAQAGAMPNIAQLMPNSANSSNAAAPLTLTVNGTNFTANAVVNWNNTALTTMFVPGGNQLVATVPGSALATPGMVQVSVTNPAVMGGIYGGGTLAETSNSVPFTIN